MGVGLHLWIFLDFLHQITCLDSDLRLRLHDQRTILFETLLKFHLISHRHLITKLLFELVGDLSISDETQVIARSGCRHRGNLQEQAAVL